MSEFKSLKPVDNFYQTSLFFPMPVVEISTISENGQTNVSSYSLVQPYYIAGKGYYAMLLECRNSSNTADRLQTDVKFTDEALMMLVNVPRVFLPLVLKGCVKWAEENGVKLITEKEMQIINDKRSKEKGKSAIPQLIQALNHERFFQYTSPLF